MNAIRKISCLIPIVLLLSCADKDLNPQQRVSAVDGLEPESEEQRMQMLLERNVMLQLQHLKTHPSVAARLAKGDLKLHGWVYDIKTGDVKAYNEAKDCFESVDVHYAKEMAEIAKSSTCAA